MKRLSTVLIIVLLISSTPIIATSTEPPKEPYRVDKGQDNTVVKSYQDKIALEREAIIEDGRRLQEARKTGDKTKIEQISQDIANRKSRVRALYKEMGNKTAYRFGPPHDYRKK